MEFRKASTKDFDVVVPLLESFYPTHDTFTLSGSQILEYLGGQLEKHPLYLALVEGEVLAALFLVRLDQQGSSHSRWKFRHFAWKNEAAAAKLLEFVEQQTLAYSQSAKIELTIAETEPGYEFFKSCAYVQEGALTNHYRLGETCFVLAKTLK